jgi:hypothetical protein
MYQVFCIFRFVNSIATSFVYSLSFKYHSALILKFRSLLKGVMVIMIRLAQYHILVSYNSFISFGSKIFSRMVRRKRHYKIATTKTFNYAIKIRKSDSLMVAVSNSMLIAISCFCSAVANDWMVLASRTCALKRYCYWF